MELVKMTRGDDVANVRLEWVDQWKDWGWSDGVESNAVPQSATAEDLDALDADQLHALAKERGVKVHANAGADKVREALRDAEKAAG